MKFILKVSVLIFLVSCQKQQDNGIINGYVEEEIRLVAAPQSGWMIQMELKEGDKIESDDFLFALDNELQLAQLQFAKNNLKAAQAKVKDLQKGIRAEELLTIKSQLKEASEKLDLARKELQRTQALFDKGLLDDAQLDAAKTNVEVAKAQSESVRSTIKSSQLGARADQILQAEALAEANRAQLDAETYNLSQREVYSRIKGTIKEVFYHQGEFVQQSAPVMSVHVPHLDKVRFYIAQSELTKIKTGQAIQVMADGLSQPETATISYISETAEFTPPVIYSKESRQKLVFLIEARLPDNSSLHAGMPVDIQL